jgi:hypothetical protein
VLGDPREAKLDVEEKRRVAIHEAGHAVVAAFSPEAEPPHRVSIIPRGMALGVTQQSPSADRHLMVEAELESRLRVLMGGQAAERLVLATISTGAKSDLKEATRLASRMVAHRRRISRAATTPSMPGIAMSIRTTSGPPRPRSHRGPGDPGSDYEVALSLASARTQGYPLVRPPDANCALLVIRAARRGGVFVACPAAISWLRATIDAPSLWRIWMFSRCSGNRAASFASSPK